MSEYKHSFYGLQHWYSSEVEKLGWMVLALQRGRKGKVIEYVKSIDQLYHAIINQQKVYTNPDWKYDLNVMEQDMKVIYDFVMENMGKPLKVELISTSISSTPSKPVIIEEEEEVEEVSMPKSTSRKMSARPGPRSPPKALPKLGAPSKSKW